MAKEVAAGGQGNTETAKGEQKAETLTGDEGKNKPAGENIDTGGDKPGEKKDEKKGDQKGGDAGDKKDEKAGDKKDDGAADDKGDKGQKEKGSKDGDQPKAPEKYDLKLPEAAGDYLDDGDLKQVEAAARAKGWTNEQAQTAVDEYADSLAAQSARFREETEKDQTYGGDNLAETQRLARLALDRVRPANTDQGKALRRDLAKSGYGNKLSVVSFLADLGKLMAEDSPSGATGGAKGGEKSTADVLYGDSPTGGG